MPAYDLKIRRSGNTAVACSVPWALEGTGLAPLDASYFQGDVLPSGLASFAAGQLEVPAVINLKAGPRPAVRRTGRLLLRDPVGCKLDPLAYVHDLSIKPAIVIGPPPGDYWEPIPLDNLADSRRTDISGGGTLNGDLGENFVLTSPATGATFTVRGTGKPGQEVVLRGNQDASDASGLRVLTNCTINLEGDYCCLGRMVLKNCTVNIKGNNCSVARCEVTAFNSTKRTTTPFNISGANASVHKNDFDDRLGDFRTCILFKEECIGARFNYNLFSNLKKGSYSDATILFYMGSSEDTTNIKTKFELRGNLFINCDVSDLWECKVSEVGAYDNTIEACGSAGFRTRHGMNHRYRRNLFIRANNAALITIRTGPHEITENQYWTEGGDPGGGSIALYAGKLHWDYEIWKDQRVPGQENNWQASGNCLVVGNFARVHVGVESGTSSSPDEVKHGYFADGHNVGPTSGASRNRVVDLTPYQKNTKRVAVEGYDMQLVLPWLKRSDVGLRAP